MGSHPSPVNHEEGDIMLDCHNEFGDSIIRPAQGYWVSPCGDILAVNTTHIDEVIKNPESFSLSLDAIKAVYTDKYEELGIEGEARREIIINLIARGWIRIRHYTRQGMWSVNINRLNKKTMDMLQYWASQMIKNGSSKYDMVRLDLPTGQMTLSVDEVAGDKLYMMERKKPGRVRVKLRPVKEFRMKKRYKNSLSPEQLKQREDFPLFKTAYSRHGLLFNESYLDKVEEYLREGGFILGSAFRPKEERTDEENILKHRELVKWIRSKKLEFFVLDGIWRDSKTNMEYPELSVLVPYKYWIMTFDEYLEFAQKWAVMYNQDAVLVKDPDPAYGKLFILNKDGSTKTLKGKMNKNQIQDIYSRFKGGKDKGKTFYFEGIQIPSSGWGSELMRREGYLW
ncbi:MAG TPA: hypothetical protein PLC28_13875 [Spirochaetota bacterium]|nr:hypothetical protein [Spirochaetota bacterium]HQJ72178.1 hypothetical protein [Spirochaetota bacterium]